MTQKIITTLFKTSDNYYQLILRVTIFTVIFPHGVQKLLGWFGGSGFAGTITFFDEVLGILPVFAVLVIIAEFFGAISLLVGFMTRFVAMCIGAIMLGAIFLVHIQNGFFMNWYARDRGEGIEFHLLVLGIILVLLLKGGGKYSLDFLIYKNSEIKHEGTLSGKNSESNNVNFKK